MHIFHNLRKFKSIATVPRYRSPTKILLRSMYVTTCEIIEEAKIMFECVKKGGDNFWEALWIIYSTNSTRRRKMHSRMQCFGLFFKVYFFTACISMQFKIGEVLPSVIFME